jgi:hypothetical protein
MKLPKRQRDKRQHSSLHVRYTYIKSCPWKYRGGGGVGVQLHSFLTLASDGREWSTSLGKKCPYIKRWSKLIKLSHASVVSSLDSSKRAPCSLRAALHTLLAGLQAEGNTHSRGLRKQTFNSLVGGPTKYLSCMWKPATVQIAVSHCTKIRRLPQT